MYKSIKFSTYKSLLTLQPRMKRFNLYCLLLLSIVIAFEPQFAIAKSPGHAHVHYHLGHLHSQDHHLIQGKAAKRSDSPSNACYGSTCTPTTSIENLPCNEISGTIYTNWSSNKNYTLICDIDFHGDDIYPFIHTESFAACLQHCEDYNRDGPAELCAAFVYAPGRRLGEDDCYLKSSTNNSFTAEIPLIGAIPLPDSALGANGSNPEGSTTSDDVQVSVNVREVICLGTSTNKPTTNYVDHPFTLPQKLSSKLLQPGVNLDLITEYPLAGDTGIWTTSTIMIDPDVVEMKVNPRLSRDGGKGGTINGTRIFIFCDTANFIPETGDNPSQMVGFVSSSVATDVTLNGLSNTSIDLVDHLGEWQDDVGRMRGFAPMTTGEEAFNIALSGNGYRYAVWPESSLISLNSTHALLYASLVYDEVDMDSQSANFTNLGNTLLLVYVDPVYGPTANRLVNQLFQKGEIPFGSLGGIRGWGISGPGNNDGRIYLLGQVPQGVMVARVSSNDFTNHSAYEYFNGTSWVTDDSDLNDDALMLKTPVMDIDILFVPLFKTFIMVYMNTLADNTFYLRYLSPPTAIDPQTGKNTTIPILPPYEKGGAVNYVESILPFPDNQAHWSEEVVMYKIATPVVGYAYAGGVHRGYYGDEDITQGGNKMLISWTEHTGQDAGSEQGGYAHKTALVVLGN